MSELVCRTLELLAETKGSFLSAVKNIFDTKTMATLKISDLSVGDWVYHDDIVFGREIAKVDRLNKDKNGETIGVTVYRSDGAFGVVGYIWTSPTQGDLHPIPITAEILEANGIHKTYEDDNYAIFRCDGLWAVKYSDGDWELSTLPVCRVDIKYVHKLQHALRLAGLDKEINL